MALAVTLAAPPDGEVARAIRELGDSRYAVREQAERTLWELGARAEAALRAAAGSADPEVARRAAQIVEKFDWGIYPDTPAEILALIGRYRSGDEDARHQSVRDLVKRGPAAYDVLAKLLNRVTAAERQAVALTVGRAVGDELPRLVRDADLAGAERLLNIGLTVEAESGPLADHYVAVVLLADRVAAVRPIWEGRAGAGSRPAAEMAVRLARAAGDAPAARRFARLAGREELIDLVLWEQGDWAALAAREPAVNAQRSGPTALDAGFHAHCQRRAGNARAARETLAKLAAGPDSADLVAQALLLNERPADALTLLRAAPFRSFEFDLHAYRLDYAAAFATAERVVNEEMLDRRGRLQVQVARTAALVGDRTRARQLFAALTHEASAPVDGSMLAEVIRAGRVSGFTAELTDHAARFLDALSTQAVTEGNDPTSGVLEALLPKRGAEAAAWWRFLTDRSPKTPAGERLRQVQAVLAPPAGTRRLMPPDLASAFFARIPDEPPEERAKGLQALAAAYRAAGQVDSARKFLRQGTAAANSATAWIRLGDFEREHRRWLDAADAYSRAADRGRPKPLALYLRADCLARLGRAAESKAEAALAFRLSVGKFEERVQLATELADRGLSDAARREREFTLQAAGEQDWYSGNGISQLAHEALTRRDFTRAADLYERTAGGILRQGLQFVDPAAYLNVPRLARLCRARAALAAGDVDTALAHADAVLELSPGDLDVPIKLGPDLANRGRPDAADALYRRVTGLYRERLKKYPDSSLLNNGLAWAAACCRRDLDEALGWARAASAANPSAPSYQDTLAEVHFQRGEQAEALAAIRRALALDPDNSYYQGQLKRIEANDRASPAAEPD